MRRLPAHDVERAQREVERVRLVLRERAAALVQNYLTSRAMVEKYRSRMIPRAPESLRPLCEELCRDGGGVPTGADLAENVIPASDGLHRGPGNSLGQFDRIAGFSY